MGMPFHGIGLLGYNKVTGEYEWIWYDNMSTGMMHGTGTKDGDELICTFHYVDPVSKQKQEARTVTTIAGDDRHVFTWYNLDDGEESKMMEVEYVRK